MFPRVGKDRAARLAESLHAGTVAAGAAGLYAEQVGRSVGAEETLGPPFGVLALFLEVASMRCSAIAADPARDDYLTRTVGRAIDAQPAPPLDARQDAVVTFAWSTRYTAARLGGLLVAFERLLGAAIRRDETHYRARLTEVRRFRDGAATGLRSMAENATFPEAVASVVVQPFLDPEDLPLEAQAYFFRSGVTPTAIRRIAAAAETFGRETLDRARRVAVDATAFASFLESWNGEPSPSHPGELDVDDGPRE